MKLQDLADKWKVQWKKKPKRGKNWEWFRASQVFTQA